MSFPIKNKHCWDCVFYGVGYEHSRYCDYKGGFYIPPDMDTSKCTNKLTRFEKK